MRVSLVFTLVLSIISGCSTTGTTVPAVSLDADKIRPSVAALTDEAAIVTPPKGFNDFCRRHADYCAGFASAQAMRVELTDTLLKQIDLTNRHANSAILPLHEGSVKDHWKFPQLTGDCEDYCLLKQRALAEAGVPMGAMPIAAVRSPEGEWHAVLLVQTDRGTLVLDNVRDTILFHDQTDYAFEFKQRPNDMMRWARIASDEILMTSMR